MPAGSNTGLPLLASSIQLAAAVQEDQAAPNGARRLGSDGALRPLCLSNPKESAYVGACSRKGKRTGVV